MINTIFYFPQNKAEYNAAEISDRTISFVPDEKAIYKNGIRYGTTSIEDLKTQIEQIFRDNPYTLPIASASRLGGIMIGKGFSIDPESGKLDVDFSSISGQDGTSGQDGHNGLDGLIKTIFENVTNLRASTTQYGIVKIKPNGGIAVNDGVISVDTSNLPSSQVDYSITGMSISGTTLSIAQNNNSRTLTVTLPTSGAGGGEPDAYLKDANASGDTLTIIKKDGTQVTFTPSVGEGGEPVQYIKTASASGNTLTLTPNTGSAITFTPSVTDGGGSTVSLERIQNSGTQIARFTIDGVVTTLFAPTPTGGEGGGEGGTTYIENPYDDAWIRSKFNAMEDRVDDTESDIRDILNETDDEIRAKFKSAFATYQSLIDYYISTGDSTYSNYTFGNDDCDTWASTRGLITRNANGTYTVGWSSLEQSYNNLSADVTQIKGQLGSGGNDIDYEMLSSGLYAYIQDNYTSAGLSSTWGKFARLSDDDIVRLQWMSSGVSTYASNSQTFASLMAAAQEYDSTGKNKLQEAYSGITALVEKDSNGRYIAKTTLTSLVDDSISGILTESSSNSAVADLFARIRDVEDETSYISGLTVDVEKLKNGDYITSAILASRIGSMSDSDKDIAFASFATKAALDNVEASMTSSLEDVTASIALCVKKNDSGVIESTAKINANQINIDADHRLKITAANQIDISTNTLSALLENVVIDAGSVDFTARNFTIDADLIDITTEHQLDLSAQDFYLNSSNTTIDSTLLDVIAESIQISADDIDFTGYSFTVNANDINLNGQTDFLSAIGDNITVKKLSAVNGSNRIDINPTDGIKQTISGTVKNQISQDGSGSFASGNIAWNTSGTTTIKGSVTTGDSGIRCEISPGSSYGQVRVYDDSLTYARLSASNDNSGWLNLKKSGGGYLQAYGETLGFYNSSSQLLAHISGNQGYGLISVETPGTISNVIMMAGNEPVVNVHGSGGSANLGTTGVTTTSDMRLKDVVAEKTLTAEQIAGAPIFTYTPKDNPNANLIVGTSAQYWQEVLPETVSEINNYLSLDYSRIATASVINLAKEVVTLKAENTTLKERVEALEARLQLIENKLNAQ